MLEILAQSPIPAYEQIVAQIQQAVLNGSLAPESPLPPIRQLAKDLDLNPATVAKAYQILEKDGVLITAGRRGTFIRGDARPNMDQSLRKEAGDQIRDLIRRWKEKGLAPAELGKLFQAMMKQA
jgi:GntR family transcriptional regulator